jgi:hypothetical protein
MGVRSVDEILFQVLAEGVGRYLDAVDRLAATQQVAAGSELRRMSAAWRALLGMHKPSRTRRGCSSCGRKGAMCTVWRVASSYLACGRGTLP